MIAQMKKTIQKPMIQKQHRLHEARIASQTVPYDVWLEKVMAEQKSELGQFTCENMNVQVIEHAEIASYTDTEKLLEYDAEVFLFVKEKKFLVENAERHVQKYVLESGADVFYADETGYFKPDYSPELLESLFYFGNVVGIKRQVLSKVKTRFDNLEQLVMFCLEIVGNAGHLAKILYTGTYEQTADHAEKADKLAIACGKGNPVSDKEDIAEKLPLISVVIPSKDNPAVLSTCIHSLLENTAGLDSSLRLEIIVVDNGSNIENRERIEKMRLQLQENYRFSYHYQEMAFNFSHMCNMGADLSTGDYVLFLNDDIEIREENWLLKMMYQAMKPNVGAVGAKLLYPDGERIQHVGITNIHLGPAHKLQFSSDKETYYMGYNRCPVNVLAVTGACMLMKKEAYDKVGGFDEKLQVSFNDVEICFHLQTLGYRNVCCNNTYLYHHESLSRGADAGLEKVRRLHEERDYLYGKYPQLWNYDPYYSSYFVRDVLDDGFESACRFEESRVSERTVPIEITGALNPEWQNECLYMGIEFAGSESAWLNGPGAEKDRENRSGEDAKIAQRYYVQGWSYAVTVDNSRYQKKLLMKHLSLDSVWELTFTPVLRIDMASKLPYIERPELTGVSVWFEKDKMPSGEYLIGYLWEDTCSRQKLYGFTAETITLS